MLKPIWSVVIWVGTVVSFSGVSGYAQVPVPLKKIEHTVELKQDPFDFIQEIVENSGHNQQAQDLGNATQYAEKPQYSASLKYHKKDRVPPEQAQAIYNALVHKYGVPKSVRGQSYVWDIENPAKSITQADIVTVILKMENPGSYELIMDRDRGENGRATWDATRIKKANKKPIKRNRVKPLLVLQENHD